MSNLVRNALQYIVAGVICFLLLAVIGFESIKRSATQKKSDIPQTSKKRHPPATTESTRHQGEQYESVEQSTGHGSEEKNYSSSVTAIYVFVGLPLIYLIYAQLWNDVVAEVISNLIPFSAKAPVYDLPESYFFVAFALLAAEIFRYAIMNTHKVSDSLSPKIQGGLSGGAVAFLSLLPVFGQLEVLSILIYVGIFAAAIGYLGSNSKGIKRYSLYFLSFILVIFFIIGVLVSFPWSVLWF